MIDEETPDKGGTLERTHTEEFTYTVQESTEDPKRLVSKSPSADKEPSQAATLQGPSPDLPQAAEDLAIQADKR